MPATVDEGSTTQLSAAQLLDDDTSTSLLSPIGISLTGGTVTDDGDERTVTDPDTSDPRKFYRVDITRP